MKSNIIRVLVIICIIAVLFAIVIAISFFPLPKPYSAFSYPAGQLSLTDVRKLDEYVQSDRIWQDLGSLRKRLGDARNFQWRLSRKSPRKGLFWRLLPISFVNFRYVFEPGDPKGGFLYIVTEELPEDVGADLLDRMVALTWFEAARIAAHADYSETDKNEIMESALIKSDLFAEEENLALLDRWSTETLTNTLLPMIESALRQERWVGIEDTRSRRREDGLRALQHNLEEKAIE